MLCRNCEFHQSSYLWNRCALTDSEYYREFNSHHCPHIDENYIFKEDFEPFGFVKGKSAIEFMKGAQND